MGEILKQTDFAALKSAYESATIGKESPKLAFVSGAVLNARLNTTEYDEDLMYEVSQDGISPSDR